MREVVVAGPPLTFSALPHTRGAPGSLGVVASLLGRFRAMSGTVVTLPKPLLTLGAAQHDLPAVGPSPG